MADNAKTRRTWTRQNKLNIIGEIGVDGNSELDVAQKHTIDRYLLKRWIRQLCPDTGKGGKSSVFVPVVVSDPEPAAPSAAIEIGLHNGRSLRVSSILSDTQIRRFIALLEVA